MTLELALRGYLDSEKLFNAKIQPFQPNLTYVEIQGCEFTVTSFRNILISGPRSVQPSFAAQITVREHRHCPGIMRNGFPV